MATKKPSPYSFSIAQEGNMFVYSITRYPYPTVLAGGYLNTRRAAEKCARLEIKFFEDQENSVESNRDSVGA